MKVTHSSKFICNLHGIYTFPVLLLYYLIGLIQQNFTGNYSLFFYIHLVLIAVGSLRISLEKELEKLERIVSPVFRTNFGNRYFGLTGKMEFKKEKFSNILFGKLSMAVILFLFFIYVTWCCDSLIDFYQVCDLLHIDVCMTHSLSFRQFIDFLRNLTFALWVLFLQ